MKSLLRYPGSKWNLAQKIVDLLPDHKSYLEPYFGSGAVLFTKSVSPIETVNDLISFRSFNRNQKRYKKSYFTHLTAVRFITWLGNIGQQVK